ncbi:hypothetical protein [Corallococcus carmarthensis]|uniref:Uncharacterized protein n=1 Tax=Corallococcus carmarthensis TaxID=2316728 RepID=A0A3A8KK06_9BACT|nr:hypothetical protein [Corallococcus carmarthensis]NOK20503.1 hypothetical protein [Corallococcus carmarthensis]RKH04561.1 hypothetical protein D7X32_10435 [Corallococcus carmarthensis]
MTSLPPPRGASVLRAAALGLVAGMLLGGLGLLVLGVKAVFVPADCAGLSAQECQLIQGAERDLGRVQTLCGGALVALGAALFALTRPRPPNAPDDSPGGSHDSSV